MLNMIMMLIIVMMLAIIIASLSPPTLTGWNDEAAKMDIGINWHSNLCYLASILYFEFIFYQQRI